MSSSDYPSQDVGRSYTRARTAPSLIGRWPGGGGRIPFGPYTWLQIGTFLGSVYLLMNTYDWWAVFGPLNLVIAIGLPVGLTFAVRFTRIEGRTPLRYAAGLTRYLTQSGTGYLGGAPFRAQPRQERTGGAAFHVGGLDPRLAAELYSAAAAENPAPAVHQPGSATPAASAVAPQPDPPAARAQGHTAPPTRLAALVAMTGQSHPEPAARPLTRAG